MARTCSLGDIPLKDYLLAASFLKAVHQVGSPTCSHMSYAQPDMSRGQPSTIKVHIIGLGNLHCLVTAGSPLAGQENLGCIL